MDLLVTEPPKPSGRGRQVRDNPALAFSREAGVRWASLEELEGVLGKGGDELGLVFSYGRIIPERLIAKFKRGILNIHPSLLPEYRGPTPIQSALLNGDKETGCTIIALSRKCDEGDILWQKAIAIEAKDNRTSLLDRAVGLALDALPEVVRLHLAGKIKPKKQDGSRATYTRKIIPSDAQITERDDAELAWRKVRAFSEPPKARLEVGGRRLIVAGAGLDEKGMLEITRIHPAGAKEMSFDEFKRGYGNLLTKLPSFVKV